MPDALGNIAGYISGGALAAAREYTPYGRLINSTGSFATYPIGYSGQYTDSETGLGYYGLRYYNPKHGRVINRDPIQEAGGNHHYGFVGNAPSRRWDVLGLKCTYSDGRWWGPNCDPGRFIPWPAPGWLRLPPPPPPPVLFSGSYTPPRFDPNLGWERDWRKFDPRAANSAGPYEPGGADVADAPGTTSNLKQIRVAQSPYDVFERDADGKLKFEEVGEDVANLRGVGPTKVMRGYLITKDGKKVPAFRNLSGDLRGDRDCHGFCLADGEYWINNPDMQVFLNETSLMQKHTGPPQPGTLVVYRDSAGNVTHSGIVARVTESEGVVVMQVAGTWSGPPDNPTGDIFGTNVDYWSVRGWTPEYWTPAAKKEEAP
jgi:RHS repeat-associated protein